MATELAKAYVQIIPSAQGMQESLSDVMNGKSESAGESGGKSFASSFGSAAKKALVGLGIGKIIADGINSASDFETAMAKTSTLFTGTGEEFDALRGTIMNLSSTYGLAATTLAEAAYSAESASVPMEQLGPMLEASAKLAQAGFTDIDTALSATAKTMNAYGDAAMSMEDIQKILIQTQNLGITTVGELGASLANVTPTAAAMGVSFDQVGAALAQMTAQGVPTAQATTQLRSAMTELGKAGTKADQAFRKATEGTKYAGMGFKEAMAAGANLGDVFGMMQSYADASGVSMVDLWGSVEAGNAAMMIASDVDRFNSNLAQMSTSADVVDEAYEKMSNTFGNSMNRLKQSATNFITTLFSGGDISTSFDNMLDSLGDVGEKLIGWLTTGVKTLAQNLPSLMSSLLDFGESLLGALGQVDWIELGTTIINGIIGALGKLGTRLAELIGGAVSSVVNGDVNFGSIGNAIWNGITSVITTAGGWLKGLFDTAVSLVAGGSVDFGSIGSTILSGITGFLDNTGNFLSNLFKTGKDAVTNGTTINWNEVGTAVLNGLTSAIDMAGHFLEGAFNAGAALVKAIDWKTVGTTIGNAVNLTIDTAGKFLEGCFTAAKGLIEAIDWNSVGTTIGNAVNLTIDTAGKFLEGCFTAAKGLIEAIDWNNIGKTIGDAVNNTVDTAGKFLEGCFKAGKTLVEKINWSEIGTKISNGVTGTIDAAGNFLKAPFEAAQKLIIGIPWDEVGKAISGGLGDVWSGVTGFLGGVLSGAGEAASGIGTGIGEAAEGIGTAIKRLFSGDDAKQAAADLEQAMRDMNQALADGKANIEASAKNIGVCIKNSIEENLTTVQMNAIGSTLISDIDAGTTITEGNLYTRLENIGTNAAAKFNGVGWSIVGQSIVTGIISGINSSAYALMLRMVTLALAAKNAAEKALGVGSPSTVMRDAVGRWIPAGIAQGITENAYMVEDAMNEMVNDATATDISGMLAAQGSGFSAVTDDGSFSSTGDGLISMIVEAVREGMENANIALYMDGEKMSMKFDEYLGDALAAGRTV